MHILELPHTFSETFEKDRNKNYKLQQLTVVIEHRQKKKSPAKINLQGISFSGVPRPGVEPGWVAPLVFELFHTLLNY